MRVAVVGAGPVGLVTGAALAHAGHRVAFIERDPERARQIAAGSPPFHEPGLPELLTRLHREGAYRVAPGVADGLQEAEVVLICVGTPSTSAGADLGMLRAASRELGSALATLPSGYRVVVVKSTVPPGTTATVVEPLIREASGLGPDALGVAMNPEFLREGVAVQDALAPDRVVLGVTDQRTSEILAALYRPFGAPLVWLSPTGAEMAKYASNTLLATLVSFSNEIAALCENTAGVDAVEVLRAVHADRRFRPPEGDPGAPSTITSYLLPGMGYGGSCFPKDTSALAAWAQSRGLPTPILDAVRAINAIRPQQVLRLLESRLTLRGAEVAVLGLAFKPDTDDLRESRSLELVDLLRRAGARVRASDPQASAEAARLLGPEVPVSSDPEPALQGADAAVVATAWPEYRRLDPLRVRALMRRPLILDARRGLDHAAWGAVCEYLSIGRQA